MVTGAWLTQTTVTMSLAADDSGVPKKLTGGVMHSEQLSPLPAVLQPGRTFPGIGSLDPNGMHRSELAAPNSADSNQSKSSSPVGSTGATSQAKKTASQTFAVGNYPKQNINALSNYQKKQVVMNSKISDQFKDYMSQQAKLGNRGTVGLKNFLDASKEHGTLNKHMVGRVGQAPTKTAKSQLLQFHIPLWLAGVWSRTESNELSRTELPANRKVKPVGKTTARVTDSFGNAHDGKGEIWQVFDANKASGSVDRGNAIDYHNVTHYSVAELSPKSVLVKVQATHVVVNKKTRKIMTAYQDEEFNTYSLLSSTSLRTDSSVKVFDQHGKAKLLTLATSNETKIR